MGLDATAMQFQYSQWPVGECVAEGAFTIELLSSEITARFSIKLKTDRRGFISLWLSGADRAACDLKKHHFKVATLPVLICILVQERSEVLQDHLDMTPH